MTTITNIAQRILDENNYTTNECTLVNAEYLVKTSVDYVNLQLDSSVAFTPSGGTQSLSGTDSQLNLIKMLSALLLRAYVEKGPNTSVGGVTVGGLTTDPQYSLFMKLIDEGIVKLRGVSFKRV